MSDEILTYEYAPDRFGTDYAVFYPEDNYLEGNYTLEDATDLASHEPNAYVVKITVERYQP